MVAHPYSHGYAVGSRCGQVASSMFAFGWPLGNLDGRQAAVGRLPSTSPSFLEKSLARLLDNDGEAENVRRDPFASCEDLVIHIAAVCEEKAR